MSRESWIRLALHRRATHEDRDVVDLALIMHEPRRYVFPDEPTFRWGELRDQLEATGAPVIGQSDYSIEIGAEDEADARRRAAELGALPHVRAGATKPLGRVRRWLIHERLLGNYGGGDPTRP